MASLAVSAELTQSLAAVVPLTLALFALVTNIGPSTAPSIDGKQRRQFRTAEKNLQDTKDNLFREMGAFRAELEVINMPPRERFGFGELPSSARADIEAMLSTARSADERMRLLVSSVEGFKKSVVTLHNLLKRYLPSAQFRKHNINSTVSGVLSAVEEAIHYCRESSAEISEAMFDMEQMLLEQTSNAKNTAALLAHDWIDYFDQLSTRQPHLTRQQSNAVRAVWWYILEQLGTIAPLPIIRTTARETIRFEWFTATEFLDLEFHKNGSLEWSVENFRTGEFVGSEEPSPRISYDFFGALSELALLKTTIQPLTYRQAAIIEYSMLRGAQDVTDYIEQQLGPGLRRCAMEIVATLTSEPLAPHDSESIMQSLERIGYSWDDAYVILAKLVGAEAPFAAQVFYMADDGTPVEAAEVEKRLYAAEFGAAEDKYAWDTWASQIVIAWRWTRGAA